jgi:cytochrome c-type biogenesis protein CcsB
MTTSIAFLLVAALVTLVATVATGAVLALAPVAAPAGHAPSGGADRSALARMARLGPAAALGFLATAVILRMLLVGHAPWSNLHEVSIAFAAGILGAHVVLARSQPIDGLAPIVALLAAGLVGLALALDDRVDPLVPALQQPLLLTVHVGSAIVAYAISAVAFAAAVGELVQRRFAEPFGFLPRAAVSRAVAHRAVLLAFPILTVAIVLGAVWANLAWRSYWSNDPKEVAAAATWLVFGAYLHVAARGERSARLAPWLIVLGFAGVLFTYLGAGLFLVGEHSYAAP